jgi:hypothetical protein
MPREEPIKLPRRPPEPPRGRPVPPLRLDDVTEARRMPGRAIRAGVGALAAVWED